MSPETKSDIASLITATSWLWLPLGACALIGLVLAPELSRSLAVATFVGGFILLVDRNPRAWLFRRRVLHFSLPVCSATIAGVWTNYAEADGGLIFLATTASGASAAALSYIIRDAELGYQDPDADPNFLRGSRRQRVELATQRAKESARPGEALFAFGPLRISPAVTTNNFFTIGAPSAGKTMLSYLSLKSVLPSVTPGSGKRVLIYDAKCETASKLKALGYAGRVIFTNFTDARASAWEIGKDFTDPHTIAEAAELLFPVPQRESSQVFFDRAVRDLATGVMLSWAKRFPGCLTLRGLINSMESETRLRSVLMWDMESNYTRLELYWGNRETLLNVLATVASKVEPFRAIAAFWDAAPYRFSLTEWREDSSVLLLGRPVEAQTAANTLNSLLIARLAQMLIKQPNSPVTNTYLFLDEMGKAGRLRHIEDLLLQGRSKGVLCWIGVQSIGSLRATYGRDTAGDITAGCGNLAVLALADPDSAEWAEQNWARHERWVKGTGRGQTAGPQGTSYTYSENWNIQLKPTVLAAEFLSLQPPSKRTRHPLCGFYRVPGLGCSFEAEISIDTLEREIPDTSAPMNGAGDELDFVPAPRHHAHLKRWSRAELSVLGLASDGAGLGTPPEPDDPPAQRRPRPQRPAPAQPPLSDLGSPYGKKRAKG